MNMGRSSVTLIPGMTIEITCPMDAANNHGFFPLQDAPEGIDLINGFAVVSQEVGTLTAGSEANKVKYTHNKPMDNTVYYYSLTGEIGALDIVNIPIHDHSSITMGGPAFGTYFNDDETSNSTS